MNCEKCVKRTYCSYIRYFNMNKDTGCIEYQDVEYTNTMTTNTLSKGEFVMKYIRTKDGHLFPYQGKEKRYIYEERGEYKSSPILNRADTIEELCDEFFMQWNEKEFPYSTYRQHVRFAGWGDLIRDIRSEKNYGKYLNQDYEVFGAIWTDKGLIYVAKMNEKGELELL